MNKIKLFLLVFCLISIIGCATGQLAWTPQQREAITTRIYNHGYDKVFDALLNRLKSKGMPVLSADKQNGIIATDYVSAGGVVWGTGKQKLNINITKLNDFQTKVALYIHVEGYSDTLGMAMTDDLIDEKHYEELFKKIDEELQ